MSDHKEQLKSVVHDLIHGRPEQAQVTIHNYLVAKSQAVVGTAPVEAPPVEQVDDVTAE